MCEIQKWGYDMHMMLPDVLLNAQEGKQGQVRLLIQAQDTLPVGIVLFLFVQSIEGEERRVETREEDGEEQGRAAHHTPKGERGNNPLCRQTLYVCALLHPPPENFDWTLLGAYAGLGDSSGASVEPGSFSSLRLVDGSGISPPSSGRSGNRNLYVNKKTRVNTRKW